MARCKSNAIAAKESGTANMVLMTATVCDRMRVRWSALRSEHTASAVVNTNATTVNGTHAKIPICGYES